MTCRACHGPAPHARLIDAAAVAQALAMLLRHWPDEAGGVWVFEHVASGRRHTVPDGVCASCLESGLRTFISGPATRRHDRPGPRELTTEEFAALREALASTTRALGGEAHMFHAGSDKFMIGGAVRLDVCLGLIGNQEQIVRELESAERVIRAGLAAVGGRR